MPPPSITTTCTTDKRIEDDCIQSLSKAALQSQKSVSLYESLVRPLPLTHLRNKYEDMLQSGRSVSQSKSPRIKPLPVIHPLVHSCHWIAPLLHHSSHGTLTAEDKDKDCHSTMHAVSKCIAALETLVVLSTQERLSSKTSSVNANMIASASDQKICTANTLVTSPPSTMADISTTTTYNDLVERIQSLQKEKDCILQLEEDYYNDISLTEEDEDRLSTLHAVSKCIAALETLLVLFKPSRQEQLSSNTSSVNANMIASASDQEMSSTNESTVADTVEPEDKERYLCVSDGFSICCFDLKDSEDKPNDLPKVPSKIYTLNLLGEHGFPFSLGLFKSGACAYMIGGQEFPGLTDSDLLSELKDGCATDWRLFGLLYEKYGVEAGSFSKVYALSRLADGSIHLSQCGNLSKCKFWPIVEKIGDRVHVIGSLPHAHPHSNDLNFPLVIPSHEVLDMNDPCGDWTELSRVPYPGCITRHLVVGHRMYLGFLDMDEQFVVFDSETNEWEKHDYVGYVGGPVYIKHVAEILGNGFGSCIGEFRHRDSNVTGPLYVVLAIRSRRKFLRNSDGMEAVAYLVTPAGGVLCFQRLNKLFVGFKRAVYGFEGIVMRSGENEKSVCVIVQGCMTDVFITTFTWEEAVDGVDLFSGLREIARDVVLEDDVWKAPPFIEEEVFIKVAVKGHYVSPFGTGKLSGNGGCFIPTRLSACFL